MTSICTRPEPTADDILFQRENELFKGRHFNGWPLADINDPFLKINLERTYKTIRGAMNQYGEVIAFRVDLTTAQGIRSGPEYFNHFIIDTFTPTLRRNLRERQKVLAHYKPGSSKSALDYLWRGNNASPGYPRTYYTMLIMNRAAFSGHDRNGDDIHQLKHQICKAWAAVNRTSPERAVRLIHCPSGVPILGSLNEPESPQELFKQASLLCRTFPLDLGTGAKLFGSSR